MRPALFLLALALPCLAEEVKTEHYDLYAEGIDAKDAGAMLEALYKNLGEYFGRVPREKLLRVEVYATNEAFQEALKGDKQGKLESGGYYSPDTKKAYLFVQPSSYYTRQLLIHEATHQFHYLAATANKNPGCAWYAEGIAEYFGLHNWDGRTLKTGVIPALTLEDYPQRALKQLGDAKDDVASVGKSLVACDRPLAWAIVHYLVNNEPRWKALAAQLDDGKKPEHAWEKAFGRDDPGLPRKLRAWLEAHQQPLRIVFVSWQERGDAMEGEGQAPAIALYKEAPGSLSVEIEGMKRDLNAGIAFNFAANEDYCVFRIAGGKIYASHFLNRVWSELASAELDPGIALHVLSMRTDGQDLVLGADGKEIHRVPAGGATGLFVEACTARFRVKK